ncbi:MAG TPA: ATP-binding protein, partial [Ignavibacteria bacterium]|nr:ATP-binding protein [Ignavibacteria bacterium]
DLSKIESGSEILKFSNISVDEIIDAAVTPLLMQFEQKKISFNINKEKNIPIIKADANKIAWVLINLLSNAIRYTPEKGKISVSVSRNENEVLFNVKDNGKGIEPNNLSKIFDKFVQLDKKNIENNKSGVGLGLSISKEFVIAHNGRIWVESESGKGTSFYFTIPI